VNGGWESAFFYLPAQSLHATGTPYPLDYAIHRPNWSRGCYPPRGWEQQGRPPQLSRRGCSPQHPSRSRRFGIDRGASWMHSLPPATRSLTSRVPGIPRIIIATPSTWASAPLPRVDARGRGIDRGQAGQHSLHVGRGCVRGGGWGRV
jgi:hypothetical protein